MENVPQVHSEQNIKDFGEWISFLDSLGYISKWQDLNAKDYGIPQNRERCFMVSYLDRGIKYAFPRPVKLEKTAKDFLEDKVSEKYYIKTEKAEEIISQTLTKNILSIKKALIDLTTKEPNINITANCITAHPNTIKTHIKEGNGVIEKIIVEERIDEGLRLFSNETCGALRTTDACGDKRVIEKDGYIYRIRKLTPLECFRLMDISDSDAKKMLAVNSETQCYKQAGNSIVVAVMVAIFNNLFLGGSEKEQAQIDIFDLLN